MVIDGREGVHVDGWDLVSFCDGGKGRTFRFLRWLLAAEVVP